MANNLTLMTRGWGDKFDLNQMVLNFSKQLSGHRVEYLFATRAQDTHLIEVAQKLGIGTIIADMNLFDQPVNMLRAEARKLGHPSLMVSNGVGITSAEILYAQNTLSYIPGAITASWQIAGQLNDGTGPGKYGYNTCWYDTRDSLELAVELPPFVNNKVLPQLSVMHEGDVKEGEAGGGEETVAKILARRKMRDARFVHFASRILSMGAKTGTNISFDWKIFRKSLVARIYLALYGVTVEEFNSWMVVL